MNENIPQSQNVVEVGEINMTQPITNPELSPRSKANISPQQVHIQCEDPQTQIQNGVVDLRNSTDENAIRDDEGDKPYEAEGSSLRPYGTQRDNEGSDETYEPKMYETEGTYEPSNASNQFDAEIRNETNVDNERGRYFEKTSNSSEDELFKKKFIKPRTQSFQSVLSTASLKSLGNIPTSNNQYRHNSIISNKSSKNFQSFIQAPVLSSVTNLKAENIEIGRQLPFKLNESNKAQKDEDNNGDDDYDEDTMIQQQRLTLNALKKLSLSPLPKIDTGNDTHSSNEIHNNNKKSEPYQPAEVDLSSFASLTRQPNTRLTEKSPIKSTKAGVTVEDSPTLMSNQKFSPLTPQNPQIPINQDEVLKYHNDIHQAHLNNLKAQSKNQLLNDLNSRRKSSPLINRVTQFTSQSPFTQSQQIQAQLQPQSQTSPQGSQALPQSLAPQCQNLAPHSHHNGFHPQGQAQNQHQNQSQYQGQPGQYQGQFGTTQSPDEIVNVNNNNTDMNHNTSVNSINSTNSTMKPINKQLQHIKGLRSPMYVPAVLRRTDEDKDISNESSAASLKSFESNASTDSLASSLPLPTMFNLPFGSPKQYKTYEHFLRQAPSRKHWIKDELVYRCSHKDCDKEFNFFERRHHCRKCGRIFCKEHVSHFLYINHLAQFTTGGRGTLSRVCDDCIGEYNEFVQHEFNLNETSTLHEFNGDSNKDKAKYYKKAYLENEQQIGNVPANWSWSSF